MNEENLSAIEIYMNRVFKLVVLLAPGATLCAALTYTAIKLLGFYPRVPLLGLGLFDCTCLFYFALGVYFARHCENADGFLDLKAVRNGKVFIAILEAVQWNFISYLIPSRDFWAYTAFFLMLVVFFLDHRYTLIVALEIIVSLFVSWVVRKDVLLPAADSLFVPNLIIRVVNVLLVSFTLWLLTFLVQTRLARELEKLADYDALTLLHNRRTMKSHIADMMRRSERGDGTFSLLMCDLDNFKRVNDTYGHECGDLILKTVANIISCAVRKDDVAFRYGGEEILVMVRANKEITEQVAERIRADIEAEAITYNGTAVNITVTIGVAGYKPHTSVDDLIQLADSRLYLGKNNGKNQVVNEQVYIEEM